MLVADDDAEWRNVVAEYLRLRGLHVLEAKDGLEALLQVKREHPQAIVLDLAMPRLGGIEALKHIAKFDPMITVVVVTGETSADLHRRASVLGVRAVLAKPVGLPDLLSALIGSTTPTSGPAATMDRSPNAVPKAAAREAARGRVLVVDDDPAMRDTLCEFGTLKGYTVRSVSNGADALRAVVEDPPDVVLLDIEMPGLAGADALIAIQAVAPAVKIIMVSGTSDAALAQRTLARGAFDYVTKPVDLDYLARSVESAVMMMRLET